MIRTKTLQLPGRRLDLTLPLAPQAVPAPEPTPCVPNPLGLFWFSDLTGRFTEASEAAYLLPEGAVGPVLGVAQVLGETCGDVQWSHQWTPESGAGGAPALVEDGAHLIVYARAETVPGILEVSARSAGRSVGPILLTLLRYQCYGYGYGYGYGSANDDRWHRVTEFSYQSISGPCQLYGGMEGTILIGPDTSTTFVFNNLSHIRELFVHANYGASSYFIVNGDGVQHVTQRNYLPPWQGAPTVAVNGISSLALRSDGYNAPFYVFVR